MKSGPFSASRLTPHERRHKDKSLSDTDLHELTRFQEGTINYQQPIQLPGFNKIDVHIRLSHSRPARAHSPARPAARPRLAGETNAARSPASSTARPAENTERLAGWAWAPQRIITRWGPRQPMPTLVTLHGLPICVTAGLGLQYDLKAEHDGLGGRGKIVRTPHRFVPWFAVNIETFGRFLTCKRMFIM